MRNNIFTSSAFGLTSGVVTTLGLIVGLASGTDSRLAVIGGIITIAIADAFSDALGMHIARESEKNKTNKEVWEATFFTFITKFFVALTFVVPVIFFELNWAVIISIVWSLFLLFLLSYVLAQTKKEKLFNIAVEHLLIALFVVAVTHYLGLVIKSFFN